MAIDKLIRKRLLRLAHGLYRGGLMKFQTEQTEQTTLRKSDRKVSERRTQRGIEHLQLHLFGGPFAYGRWRGKSTIY